MGAFEEFAFVPRGASRTAFIAVSEGMTHAQVEKIRAKLDSIGYLTSEDTPSSLYGRATGRAVGRFKSDWRNIITNQDPEVVDFDTYWLLNQVAAIKQQKGIVVAPGSKFLEAKRPSDSVADQMAKDKVGPGTTSYVKREDLIPGAEGKLPDKVPTTAVPPNDAGKKPSVKPGLRPAAKLEVSTTETLGTVVIVGLLLWAAAKY
jgi:hypothetical protein